MTMRLTRRGRIVFGAAAGLLAVAAGAATATVTNRIDAAAQDDAAATQSESTQSESTQSESTQSESTQSESTQSESTQSESTQSESTQGESTQGDTGGGVASPSPTPPSDSVQAARGTTAWQVPAARQAENGQIAGFAAPFVLPGQPIRLRVSTRANKFNIVAYRIGHYQGKGATKVQAWGPLRGKDGRPARTDPETGAIAASWPIAAELDTDGWLPGLYLLALTTRSRSPKTYTVPIVIASESARGRVLLVAGDTTWQAHNTWGGRSAYSPPDGYRSRAVSFARPYPWSGYRWPAAFDIPLIRLAEKQGIPLAYGSITSVSAHPESVSGALGIISNGHDEYWTASYRNALVKARDMGTNLAFMGANAGYRQTELRDGGWTAMIARNGAMQRWRDNPDAVAENALTGQLYDCFPARADMVIRDPRFFLFAGTGVHRGTVIRNLVGAATDRVYPLESTPRPIQIPALSPVKCAGFGTWSTLSYYTTPSGAGVLATGTMDWVRAMGGPRGEQGLGDDALKFTRKVTANLLKAMAAGPMGKSNPAVDQLDDVDLPPTSTTTVPLGSATRE